MIGINRNATSFVVSNESRSRLTVDFVEEPDLWRKKSLEHWFNECRLVLGDVYFTEYQQSLGLLDMTATFTTRYDAVLPGLEYSVRAAAALAEELGLPGAGVTAAETLTDKLALRRATMACAWGTVRFDVAASAPDVAKFCEGGPAILKPANRQASVGVQHVGPDTDFERAWDEVTHSEELGQTVDRPLSWRYLLEERLSGDEYSVEALCADGQVLWTNLTRKFVTAGPFNVELAHVITPVQAWCHSYMQDLVDAVGFGSGMLHAEWMVTEQGPRLIECAGRPPGDQILDIIEMAWDFNPVQAWVDVLKSQSASVPRRANRSAAVAFIVAPAAGEVAEDGRSGRQPNPDVSKVNLQASVGQTVRPPRSSWDRLGYVLARGDDEERALRVALETATSCQPRIVSATEA